MLLCFEVHFLGLELSILRNIIFKLGYLFCITVPYLLAQFTINKTLAALFATNILFNLKLAFLSELPDN